MVRIEETKVKIRKCTSNNLPFNEKCVKGSWEMNVQPSPSKSIPRKVRVPSAFPLFLYWSLFNPEFL